MAIGSFIRGLVGLQWVGVGCYKGSSSTRVVGSSGLVPGLRFGFRVSHFFGCTIRATLRSYTATYYLGYLGFSAVGRSCRVERWSLMGLHGLKV